MVKPGKRMKVGREVVVGGVRGVVEEICDDGERLIRFDAEIDVEKHGHLALPHYIGRDEEAADRERYQTVYGEREGAVAAPTAGLHFTEELLAEIDRIGIRRVAVTLHVGAGTFRPVRAESVEEHRMHAEYVEVDESVCTAVRETRARGGRVVAVGTTSARVLESCVRPDGRVEARRGETDLFLRPGVRFRAVDALLTNFHLPRSSLILLVAAFAGRAQVLDAYRTAVAEGYRFYSYGDAMLVL